MALAYYFYFYFIIKGGGGKGTIGVCFGLLEHLHLFVNRYAYAEQVYYGFKIFRGETHTYRTLVLGSWGLYQHEPLNLQLGGKY